jgi:hypothetical protein
MKTSVLIGLSLLAHSAFGVAILKAAPTQTKPLVTKSTSVPVLPAVIKVADANDAMRGRIPKNPIFPKITPKKGTVRGWIRTIDGKPLGGAQNIAQSSYAGGFRTSSKARSNAMGLYEIVLPVGICEVVNADVKIRYNGKSYLLPLHPADGELNTFSSGAGHIENFVLRTYGPANDDYDRNPEWGTNYYGGRIRVQWFSTDIPDGNGKVEITMTPEGALLDGSKGSILIFTLPQKSGEHFLNDIPIGKYQMSVRFLQNGKYSVIKPKKLWDENASNSLQIEFKSMQGELASLHSCGVESFEVQLVP